MNDSREALLKRAETHAIDLHLRGLYQGEQTLRELAAALATIPEAPKQDAREGAVPAAWALFTPDEEPQFLTKRPLINAGPFMWQPLYAAPQPRAEPRSLKHPFGPDRWQSPSADAEREELVRRCKEWLEGVVGINFTGRLICDLRAYLERDYIGRKA